MQQAEHAQKMTERFRELVEEAGDELPAHHYDQLRLIILKTAVELPVEGFCWPDWRSKKMR